MLPQIIVYFAIDFFSCIPFWRIAFTTIVDNTSAQLHLTLKSFKKSFEKWDFFIVTNRFCKRSGERIAFVAIIAIIPSKIGVNIFPI